MDNLIDLLIPSVSAQAENGADALAQPTFGPINIGDGSSTTSASVLLKSTKTSAAVGERFKVTVEVKTNEIQISEYRLVIDYDPSKIRPVDADPASNGTQITVLDTVFTPEDPEEDNLASTIGRIRLNATSVDGQRYAVNKDVVEIEFQAQATGSTTIKVVEDASGTQIIRQSGVGLSYTSNEITVQVNAQSTGNTNNNTGNNTGTNTGTGTGTTGGQIPNTAISPEMLSAIMSLGMGFFLVLLGSILFIKSEKPEDKDKTRY